MEPIGVLGGIATAGALITGGGGLILSYMCVRWARSGSDRVAGAVIAAVAVAHVSAPIVALTMAGSWPTAAAIVAGVSLALSIGLVLVLPAAISAAGQP
jgi:hypothetical protein